MSGQPTPSSILTTTGTWVDPLCLDPETVHLVDVGIALSRICRFTGHGAHFYSVAEHCVLLARYVREEWKEWIGGVDMARWALLHDASEAYLCDLPRPIKKSSHMEAYTVFEFRAMRAIANRFGLSWPMPEAVHVCDQAICATEMFSLFHWQDPSVPEPLPVRLGFWTPERASFEFFLEAGKLGLR